MRMQWNETVLMICVCSLAALVGCGSGGSVANDNANANQNAGNEGDANVTFPDVSADAGDNAVLIGITDEGGISGTIFGGTNGDGSTATISRIEGSTDEDNFVASFDSNLRTDRVSIGDTELNVDYDAENMFTYSVNRGTETVFSGSGLVAIRTDAASIGRTAPIGGRTAPIGGRSASLGGRTASLGGRTAQRVDPAEVTACREALLRSLADFAEIIEAPDSGNSASPEFIACLEEVDSIRRLASALCTVQLVFAPALEEIVSNCTSQADPLRCLNRALPAIAGLVSFYNTLNVVLIDIVLQIRRDAEFCSAGG